MGNASITKAQRKAIREAGPYYVTVHGTLECEGVSTWSVTRKAEAAALNAIAGEDEAVVRTREALLRAASRGWDYSVTTSAADDYYEALRAAKKRAKR
jgi:hypothetical protein